ncbi:glycyl-radical enzyme activating protein [Chloroflexota bacterium]
MIVAKQILKAAIWKIDRSATHDGPGIRTNLYFKGCPLRCLWCSNPEGQHASRELAFTEARCTGCRLCFNICPKGAIKPKGDKPEIEFSSCDQCGQCVSVCSPNALSMYARTYTLPQVMDIISRDRYIYRKSGGGITCTGGEPFLQAEFLKQLLLDCKNQGIHTAVETCGYANQEEFKGILANIDLLFFDLKHIDNKKHLRLTGRSNRSILINLRTVSSVFAESGKVLIIRQVVVPGLNDSDNIKALVELANGLPRVDMIELLPYHAFGSSKYSNLGRRYNLDNLEPPSTDELHKYKETIESNGVRCEIGEL